MSGFISRAGSALTLALSLGVAHQAQRAVLSNSLYDLTALSDAPDCRQGSTR
ncbi:MAG: hypothetical protein ACFBRM_13825 [Pikeienuella sp.]